MEKKKGDGKEKGRWKRKRAMGKGDGIKKRAISKKGGEERAMGKDDAGW